MSGRDSPGASYSGSKQEGEAERAKEKPGGLQEAAGPRGSGWCCYQVNVLTAVVGGATDVENFDLERTGLCSRASTRRGGMREATATRETEMLERRQWSMVARGSVAAIVGISTGCRRHLRRRWWCTRKREGEMQSERATAGAGGRRRRRRRREMGAAKGQGALNLPLLLSFRLHRALRGVFRGI